MDITIPGLGDIDEVEVIELCVEVGDIVEENDTILVIESDKASMDVPSPGAGTVASIEVAIGDMVAEGTLIAKLSDDDNSDATAKQSAEPSSEPSSEPEVETVAAPIENVPEAPPAPAPTPNQAQNVEVLVPDIGDANGVVVIEIAVAQGDVVAVDDLLVVLESDKASMEITAEQAGTVVAVAVSEDQEVEQGSHIVTLAVTDNAIASTPSAAQDVATDISPVTAPQPTTQSSTQSKMAAAPESSTTPAAAESTDATQSATPEVYAGPAVRKLARELGADLTSVKGSGNRGRITKDDVKAHVKTLLKNAKSPTATNTGSGIPPIPAVDFSKFGETELKDLTRIQQRGAENLHRSWVNLPHVTQHDEADITDMEAFRKSLKTEAESKGVRVTPLAFLVKACCAGLREYPNFNSSLAENHQQLILKKYINIGMAVDTPDGLVVPVIKDADQKSIWELSEDIANLSEKARTKKLAMDDLQGGTFSISSLGALGGTGFTPIVNAPEVAILGVAKLQTKPVWDGEAFVPRKMLPLSLSYDHRVINGADGGRFMQFLTSVLSDVRRLAL